jgi:hypothetical protein
MRVGEFASYFCLFAIFVSPRNICCIKPANTARNKKKHGIVGNVQFIEELEDQWKFVFVICYGYNVSIGYGGFV